MYYLAIFKDEASRDAAFSGLVDVDAEVSTEGGPGIRKLTVEEAGVKLGHESGVQYSDHAIFFEHGTMNNFLLESGACKILGMLNRPRWIR